MIPGYLRVPRRFHMASVRSAAFQSDFVGLQQKGFGEQSSYFAPREVQTQSLNMLEISGISEKNRVNDNGRNDGPQMQARKMQHDGTVFIGTGRYMVIKLKSAIFRFQ